VLLLAARTNSPMLARPQAPQARIVDLSIRTRRVRPSTTPRSGRARCVDRTAVPTHRRGRHAARALRVDVRTALALFGSCTNSSRILGRLLLGTPTSCPNRRLGFDSLYLTPVAPDSDHQPQGPQHALTVPPRFDPGSPWRSARGRWRPLGRASRLFNVLGLRAPRRGRQGPRMDIANDVAIQCSGHHPC